MYSRQNSRSSHQRKDLTWPDGSVADVDGSSSKRRELIRDLNPGVTTGVRMKPLCLKFVFLQGKTEKVISLSKREEHYKYEATVLCSKYNMKYHLLWNLFFRLLQG